MSESITHSLEHARFGPIELDDQVLIHCNGLPGFPEARRLALLEHDRPSWFAWLICLELPEVAFAVTDPRRFYPDYSPSLHLSDLRAIGAEPDDDLDMLVIANMTGEGNFLNLAAPLLVNPTERRVVQAILVDEAWPLWAPLEPLGEDPKPSQMESNPHR